MSLVVFTYMIAIILTLVHIAMGAAQQSGNSSVACGLEITCGLCLQNSQCHWCQFLASISGSSGICVLRTEEFVCTGISFATLWAEQCPNDDLAPVSSSSTTDSMAATSSTFPSTTEIAATASSASPAATSPAPSGPPTGSPTSTPAPTAAAPTPPPRPCLVGDWSDWSPCSIDCVNADRDRGEATRRRAVTQTPLPADAECPALVETETCLPEIDCESLQCLGDCAGCTSSNLTPGTATWCRCCAAQDVAGPASASLWDNPCAATGGCPAEFSSFQFAGCLAAGYCSILASNPGQRMCGDHGYCDRLPTPAPVPGQTPAPTPAPTPLPTRVPTHQPTRAPQTSSTGSPTPLPTTASPSARPTPMPTTASPSANPTPLPTPAPVPGQTPAPTPWSTRIPTHQPTGAPQPSSISNPTPLPTTASPSARPSSPPSAVSELAYCGPQLSCSTCLPLAHCQWCQFEGPISGFTGICVLVTEGFTCTGITGALLFPDQCPGGSPLAGAPTVPGATILPGAPTAPGPSVVGDASLGAGWIAVIIIATVLVVGCFVAAVYLLIVRQRDGEPSSSGSSVTRNTGYVTPPASSPGIVRRSSSRTYSSRRGSAVGGRSGSGSRLSRPAAVRTPSDRSIGRSDRSVAGRQRVRRNVA